MLFRIVLGCNHYRSNNSVDIQVRNQNFAKGGEGFQKKLN